MEDFEDDAHPTRSKGQLAPKTLSRLHEFYISGIIKSPDHYTDTFDAIRHAGADDAVKLYINTYGGDMFTAIQFMRVLSETKALVIASVEGACMSAGTLLFLSADQIEVSQHSVFMFHNYSGGTFGKGGEMFAQVQHERKWSEKLLNEIYEDFLTKEEIVSLLDNRDIWLDVEEVVARMEKRIAAREEAEKIAAAEEKAASEE